MAKHMCEYMPYLPQSLILEAQNGSDESDDEDDEDSDKIGDVDSDEEGKTARKGVKCQMAAQRSRTLLHPQQILPLPCRAPLAAPRPISKRAPKEEVNLKENAPLLHIDEVFCIETKRILHHPHSHKI
mmetsp:Transcript_6724/g.25199  ORF Transcript_6724/g.25199 Transcript_6724/m.25199 type:complete len:128 (+) Transcript_6724:477-860(+)